VGCDDVRGRVLLGVHWQMAGWSYMYSYRRQGVGPRSRLPGQTAGIGIEIRTTGAFAICDASSGHIVSHAALPGDAEVRSKIGDLELGSR
jgi:hypothetical protein